MYTQLQKAETTEKIINGLIDKFDIEFQEAFLSVVREMKSVYLASEIESFIEQGIILEKIDELSERWSIFADVVIAGIVTSGITTAEEIAEQLGIFVNFDRVNTRLVEQLQQSRFELISGLTQQQRDVTRASLVESATRGLNPRSQAILIRDTIGLTARQEAAVANYRRLLENNSLQALNLELRDRRFDASVSRANLTGQALSTDQIDRMVERYRERNLILRSETVARTESLRAAHAGQNEMFLQAIGSGAIDGEDLERTWITAADTKVRDSHNGMNGQVRRISEPFISDNGVFLRYPGDPQAPAEEVINCRCTLVIRFRRVAIGQF